VLKAERGWAPIAGRRVSYLRWPSRSQADTAPLLCLHPVNTAAAVWTDVAEVLSADRTVIAVDYRGHGSSDASGPYFPAEFAGDARAVLARLGLDRVHLTAGSIGGAVAVELLAAEPDRFLSVSAFGATMHIGRPDSELDAMIASLRELGVRGWFDRHGGEIFGPRAQPNSSERLTELASGRDVETVAEIIRTTFGQADVRRLAEGLHVTVPSLVLVGSEDPTTPLEMAEQLAGALGAGTVTVIDGVGHLPMLEVPELTARWIAEHCAGADKEQGP
jgi:3-oxoadipate enol-lactonase